ncbi:unnamed protein product [Arctogadus glacialis]
MWKIEGRLKEHVRRSLHNCTPCWNKEALRRATARYGSSCRVEVLIDYHGSGMQAEALSAGALGVRSTPRLCENTMLSTLLLRSLPQSHRGVLRPRRDVP